MTDSAPGRTVLFYTGGDRFEDWFDKVGISLETFRTELTGGWLFNYVDALREADIRTVMFFASARIDAPLRFVHEPTGASVCVVPVPRIHRKLRAAQRRFALTSSVVASMASYAAVPVRALAAEIRRERCDVILCQEYEHPRFDVCVALGRLLRVPVFATYQGSQRPLGWVERILRGLSVRWGSGLIIAADVEVGRVRAAYGLDPASIAHIPNPMDVAAWRPGDRRRAREQIGIEADALVVVWHGHVQIRRKGLDVLLDAWDLVRARRPELASRLLIVGSGRNTSELTRRVEAEPTITWIDQYVVDRSELWRYLSAADVYTLPSRHEGFAVAPVEAMACGLPIVAADASGVADLLEHGEDDGGLVVPRGDADALASAVLRVLDDPEWARELGARARRRAETAFSLEIVGGSLRRFLFDARTPPADQPSDN